MEDRELYQRAFGQLTGDPADAQLAGATILNRFLLTHALVGLADVLQRYPFEQAWAERQLEEWARTGRAVVVQGDGGPLQGMSSGLEETEEAGGSRA